MNHDFFDGNGHDHSAFSFCFNISLWAELLNSSACSLIFFDAISTSLNF